jgi:uncharacterized damage-inducible protein DinB
MAFGRADVAHRDRQRVPLLADRRRGVPAAGRPLPSDKPTVLKGLAASFDHCAAIADKLTPAQLDASYQVDWVGMPAATGRQILSAMFTHTAHHRGQAEVYLRLKGIVPPKYRY